MRVAGFREKSNAKAAATVLREQGYETEIIGVEGEASPSRLGDLPEPVLNARWAQAFVLSTCDSEHFREIVANHLGTVVWQHRPGRFSRLEREHTTHYRT
jgi:hypothetical protein